MQLPRLGRNVNPLTGRRRTTALVGGFLALAVLSAIPAAAATRSTPNTTAASTSAAAATTTKTSAKPTVVLVHGAFADASGWNDVITRLTRDGYPVRALPNPLRGLKSDAAYLRSFLATIPGPVVLAGHSYGGAVITEAATGDKDVKALVYIAAFAPAAGETLGGLSAKPVAHPVPALPAVPVPYTKADGTPGTDLYLDATKFRATFAADLPTKLTTAMAATQRPAEAGIFGEVASTPAWKTIPSWSLVATQDKAIAPDLERFMAKRANSRIVEVKASHAAMTSQPKAVANLIETAARATR